MNWIFLALASSVAAGLTSVFAKLAGSRIGSQLLTLLRTIVVVILAWGIVFLVGSEWQIGRISAYSLLFLILSGLATGASWLCYYRALQLSDVSHVTPLDQSSVVLSVLFAIIFLGERTQLLVTLLGLAVIAAGTILIIIAKNGAFFAHSKIRSNSWIFYALGSAVFAALTAILGKVGITAVESNLGTAIRTLVVIPLAMLMVIIKHEGADIHKITRRDLVFIVLSGLGTALSWLCYYRALQLGPAALVVPIDKTSVVVAVLVAYLFLHEKISRLHFTGLVLIVLGTLGMVIFGN